MPSAIHHHTCATCAHEWACHDLDHQHDALDQCPVSKAAVVNHSGPFCLLCLHLEMARRFAAARHLTLTFTLTPVP